MYDYAFATAADRNYLPGLWALLNSIYAYHGRELRVFAFLYGEFPPYLLQGLNDHPLGPALTLIPTSRMQPAPVGCWEAKQKAFDHLMGRARYVCLLDSDLVLLSSLQDVFEMSASGKIVSCRDGSADMRYDESYAAYGETVVGARIPYFNSGFLCLDTVRHWDLAGLWSFAGRFGSFSPGGGYPLSLPGWGDQGVLNAVATLLNKAPALQLYNQEEWCNCQRPWGPNHELTITGAEGDRLVVRNSWTGGRQRLLHSTGPKWWTEDGAKHFSQWPAVYDCFQHFASSPAPYPRPEIPSVAEASAGTLRYIGDISRQDAQILATYAAMANRILEFGVGGSTQVLAQCAPPDASIITLDTCAPWIEENQIRTARLGIARDVTYLLYPEWNPAETGPIDLAFVDGIDALRLEFAARAWKILRVGGAMLFHDTRRTGDVENVLRLVSDHHLEVDAVQVNVRASNITVVTKKIAEPYVNWQLVESKVV